MAKENISYTTLRLNVDNPKQCRVVKILNTLNPEVHKNKTQFILAAVEFYIDHYGEEYFSNTNMSNAESFITKNEMEVICNQIKEEAATAARIEVIRLLGDRYADLKQHAHADSNNKMDSQTANAILDVALNFDDD